MEKRFPFRLLGIDFCLNTILKFGAKNSYIFSSSLLQRIEQSEATNTSVNTKQILANYKSISKCLDFPISIFVFNKYESYILSNGKITVVDNTQITETPLVLPNSFKDNKINADFAENILNGINISNIGLNIFAGELVWCNWFNTFTLVELLLKKDENSSYFTFDTFGVWEYLLNNLHKDDKLSLLDKIFFIPQFTFINNFRDKVFKKGEKINLIRKNSRKSIYLLNQPFSFFDLNKDGFEIVDRGYYLNRFVLIKSSRTGQITKSMYDKDVSLFSSHFNNSSKFIVSNIENAKKSIGDIFVKFLYKIKKSKKINQKIKKGDRLVDIGFRKVNLMRIPRNAVIAVVEKQIISVGDVLYKLIGSSGTRIVTSKIAGTISLKRMKENILIILSDEHNIQVKSLFSGNIVSVDKMELRISTDIYRLPLFNKSSGNLYGVLIDIKSLKKVKESVYPYIVYIRNRVDKFEDIYKFPLSGILIKHKGLVSDKFLMEAKKYNVQINYVNSNSFDVNIEYEKILHRCLGKYINIRNNSIIISSEDIEDFIKFIDNNIVGNELKKGINVKFYNNESSYLYGNIEKVPNNKGDRLLINMKDGVYEANIGNILIL